MRRLLAVVGLSLILAAPMWAKDSKTPAGCAGTGACYWIGGTGNWSDTAHWATADGGSTTGSVPTSADDVFFTASSNATAYTVTVDATATCRDLTFANPGTSGVVTLAGSATINIYGSLSKASGMTDSYLGTFVFSATSGTKTITNNSSSYSGSIEFNGTGGTFQLVDDLTINSYSRSFKLTSGTFLANSRTVTLTPNLANGYLRIYGHFTFYNLTISVGALKGTEIQVYDDFTVTNAFTINGNSGVNRIYIYSSSIGTPRLITLTAGASGLVTTSGNFDLRDIQFNTGGANLDLSGLSGGTVGGGTVSGAGMSGGGTLTTSTPINAYWVHPNDASSHNWSDVTYWKTASGGAVAARVPLMQDTAIFDAASFPHSGDTVVQDMPRIGSVDWTGGAGGAGAVTNNPTFTTSTAASAFGSMILVDSTKMTLTASTQTYTKEGRGSYVITSAGQTRAKNFVLNAPTGTYTLTDAFSTTGTWTVTNGTLALGGNNLTAASYSQASGGTLTTGNALITLTGTGTVWTGAGTVTATGSTIKLTGSASAVTFSGGTSLTYGGLWYSPSAGTSGLVITATTALGFSGTVTLGGSANYTVIFPNVTTTVANMVRGSDAGVSVKTLQRTGGSGSFTLSKSTSGMVFADYLSISNSTASPASTWYAGPAAHSTDGGGNSGWIFSVPPQKPTLGLLGVGK